MILEWLSTNSTFVTALAGMAATAFTTIYITRDNSRRIKDERRDNIQQETLTERKAAYKRMLCAFEEFEFTLLTLQRHGYSRSGMASMRFTKNIRALINLNLKVDLTIQTLERELELIAPRDVVEACRGAFCALRKMTRTLTDDGVVNPRTYTANLSRTAALMRLDLAGRIDNLAAHTIEDATKDMANIYRRNAPQNAIKLWMDSMEGSSSQLTEPGEAA